MLSRFRPALPALLAIALFALPAASAQAKSSVKPTLKSVTAVGQNLTIKGSAKAPAKKSLHGKSLTVKISVAATTGKPVTKSSKLKAKKKPKKISFKVSIFSKAVGKLKVTAQLYIGKKKYGKASKSKSVTVTALPPSTGFSAAGIPVSVGGSLACALSGPNLKCWGASGQVGTGNNAGEKFPTTVIAGLQSSLVNFSAGSGGGCAMVNGSASCWGANYYGQLGNGKNYGTDPLGAADSNVPVAVHGINGGGRMIDAGDGHTCAINNGKIQCWGLNSYGQLGNGTDTNGAAGYGGASEPVDVVMPPGMGTPYSVSAGGLNTCANTSSGIWCWGNNNQGQLGIGTHDGEYHHNTPVHVGGVLAGISYITNSDLSVGTDHICAQLGGHAYCWGSNWAGQLGKPLAITESDEPISPDVLPINAVATVSADHGSTCALALETAYCFGTNNEAKIGNGTMGGNVPTPTPVIGLEHGAGSVSTGWYRSCGSKAGQLYCWGDRGHGFGLGDGSGDDGPPTYATSPVPVQGL
jgi:hypothetical protein